MLIKIEYGVTMQMYYYLCRNIFFVVLFHIKFRTQFYLLIITVTIIIIESLFYSIST